VKRRFVFHLRRARDEGRRHDATGELGARGKEGKKTTFIARTSAMGARVEVFARIRPRASEDADADVAWVASRANAIEDAERGGKEGKARVCVSATSGMSGARAYDVDGAFDGASTQEEVYAACAAPVLDAATKGCRGCVMAYGQTGSGKTYSLLNGDDDDDAREPGLVPRLAVDCFARAASDSFHAYEVSCAMAQIYNEQVDDLVAKRTGLKVMTASDGSGYEIDGLSWTPCHSAEDVLECFKRGRSRLVYAETHMNKHSSRSHCVFQMKIDRIERPVDVIASNSTEDHSNYDADADDASRRVAVEMRSGLLTIVDLAGSERQKKTQNIGARFKEATNINTSLLALGNVVSALAAGHRHIPYRDSTLTKILEPSLNGKSRTTLLVCVSAEAQHASETANSLDFATRAMRIETSPEVRSSLVDVDPCKLKIAVQQLRGQANDEALTRVLQDVDALRRTLASTNKNSEEDILALKKSRDAMQHELCATRLNLETCKVALERAREETATTTRELNATQGDKITLETRVRVVTMKLSATHDEMRNERASFEDALLKMEHAVRKLESQLNAERASTSRALVRVEALIKSVSDLRSANVELERDKSLLNVELERARSTVGSLRVDHARLMRRHLPLEAKHADSTRECEKLREWCLTYFVRCAYSAYRHDAFAEIIAEHTSTMTNRCLEAETRRARDSIVRRAAARRSTERSALVLALERDKTEVARRLRRAERRGSEIDVRYANDVAMLRAEIEAQRRRLDAASHLYATTADRQLERGVVITKIARNGKRYDRILRVNAFTGALESAPIPTRFKTLATRPDGVAPSPSFNVDRADGESVVTVHFRERDFAVACAHFDDACWPRALAKRFAAGT